ncbi:hypothetical protein ACEQPO_14545 [Bacillus sp. SL00103]
MKEKPNVYRHFLTGLAVDWRGNWTIVEGMIEEILGGCEVMVYRFK